MSILQVRDLHYSPGSQPVLSGVSFSIDEGERVGLVGTNGCGKSSLLRIMGGEVEPDRGEVVRRRGLRIGAVSQFLPVELEAEPVLSIVCTPDGERHQAESLLTRLGFATAELEKRAGELSGGEVNRLLLARAVAREPDVILLDEPTNHLDVETVVLFQQFLLESLRKAFVLVSHDRELLDALTERTVFLRGGIAKSFDLGYSHARHALLEAESAALAMRDVQQKKIDRVTESMNRLAHWGHIYNNEKFARRARSMGKRVSKMEAAREPAPWSDRRRLGVRGDAPRAVRLLDLERLPVATPDGRALFEVEALHVRRGDRVALLGENGTGKSTLLEVLRAGFGEEMPRGIRFNPQVRLGYYDQELRELTTGRTLLGTVARCSDAPADRLRSALVAAGFPAREHERPIDKLSGGEKSRLLFLVLELSGPNFILLDEPTNHMDVEGCEALEGELLQAGLTVLFVSHDRRFTESVANRFVQIRAGRLEEVDSLERYFDELEGAAGPTTASVATTERDVAIAGGRGQADETDRSADAKLARIIELEAKLEADIARKPKHQKPARQADWRAEIAALYAQLD